MSYLDHVCSYVDGATAFTESTNLFKGLMPETPDTCVTLYETPGRQPSEQMGNSQGGTERPNLQVISRASDYVTARTNAQTVWNALRLVTEQTLSGVRYLRIQPLQSPFLLNRDDNQRVRVAFNCMVEKELG